MSSFICSSEHFNSVEKKLFHTIFWSSTIFHMPRNTERIAPKLFNTKHYGKEAGEKELKEIFNTLKELSVICVLLQYKHRYEDIDKEIADQMEIVKMDTRTEPLTLEGLYKAIGCIHYQIEIEQLEQLRELTKKEEYALEFIESIRTALASHIVSNSEGYNEAKYSI